MPNSRAHRASAEVASRFPAKGASVGGAEATGLPPHSLCPAALLKPQAAIVDSLSCGCARKMRAMAELPPKGKYFNGLDRVAESAEGRAWETCCL